MNQDNSNVFVENTDSTNASTNRADYITCGRCGSEMKKDARYCMKCGNLNYAHQDNAFMKQYAINDIKQGNYISGMETAKNNGLEVPKEIVNRPYTACLITNIILYLIPVLLIIILLLLVKDQVTINALGIFIFIFVYAILFVESYGYQRVLIKAGQPWWSYFVPIYNFYVFFKVTFGNGWIFLVNFIPIVGFIFDFVAFYKLGKRFYKSGWLTLFFPFIMIPLIGFDSSSEYTFNDSNSLKNSSAAKVDSKGRTDAERSYRAKKIVFTIIVLIGFGITIWLGWDYVIKAYEFFLEQLEFFK